MGVTARLVEAWRSDGPAAVLRVLENGMRWRVRRLIKPVARWSGLTIPAAAAPVPGRPSVTSRQMTSTRSLAAAAARLAELDLPVDQVERTATTSTPSVAVIVPTYNDSRFLTDALESVRRQTYPHWRCLVVDDASQQPVWPIVESVAANDPRFVYLRHGRNAGLAAARNTGLRSATETYVQLLDADDMLAPTALEERIRVLQDHGDDPTVAGCHGLVVGCTEETTVDDVATWRDQSTRARIDWIESDGEPPFVVNAVLLRTDVAKAIGGFDETYVKGAEDWEFWHRILRHGYVFVPARGVAGAYRQHAASMTRNHADVHFRRADALVDLGQSWVQVDPDVAVGPANMPLGDARQALRRVYRAAWWAGIRMAHGAPVDEAIDDEILAFVRDQPMVGTRRHQIVSLARRGLLRGLGLAPGVDAALPLDAKNRLHTASALIADRLLDLTVHFQDPPANEPVAELFATIQGVGFVLERPSENSRLLSVAQHLADAGLTVVAVDVDHVDGDDSASGEWRRAGTRVVPYSAVRLGRIRPRGIVASHPATPEALDLLGAVEVHGGRAHLCLPERSDQRSAITSLPYPAETVESLVRLYGPRRVRSAGELRPASTSSS